MQKIHCKKRLLGKLPIFGNFTNFQEIKDSVILPKNG